MSDKKPKIHNNGNVACPRCGCFTMFLTKVSEAETMQKDQGTMNIYEADCGNLDCAWSGEL